MQSGVAALERNIARFQSAKDDAKAVLATGLTEADERVREHFLQQLAPLVPTAPRPLADGEDGAVDSGEAKLGIADAMVSYEELLRLETPERKQHLAWLKEGSLAMVFGPRGIGKTMLQLGLTAGLVTGTKFLAWNVSAPVGVLYVDGEMPLDELRSRTKALLTTPPKAPLRFLTSEVVYNKTQRDLTLTSAAVQEEITATLDAHPDIRVVILDNISSLFVGIDEDRKRDWEPINAWLVRLRHRGLSVVLVHHAGKGGNQRGTSGREDALDVVIQLDRPSQYDPREGCHFELRFTKTRSVKGDDVTPLDIRLTEEAGHVQLNFKPLEDSKQDQVKRLLDAGLTSPSDVAAELDISKGYACKLIQNAKNTTFAA